jgi:simple sugar transport system ATP-binding protein
VLLVSLDLDEVMELSDRIVVLCAGRVTGEFKRSAFDERLIGQRMLGIGSNPHPDPLPKGEEGQRA